MTEIQRTRQAQYKRSPQGRAVNSKYNKSTKGHAAQRRYDQSPKGRLRRSRAWAARIKHHYGLTPAEYHQLYNVQQGKCALGCGRAIYGIDHDHVTGLVRGLLCRACNSALGTLGDEENGLTRALEYVRRGISDRK